KGDVLLKIDPTNFESAMRQAEAVLADAVLNQEVEKARVEQALVDWNRVGRKAKPTELLLRRPYLASAEAKVKSARAAVEKAVADLERTRLTALYDGRIKSTHTDLGSFAAPGTLLAELYATGTLEIRLPVSLDDYAFIDRIQSGERSPTVKLNSLIAGTSYEWDAVIVRTEGQVDHANRSIYLVANLDTKALARKFDTIDIDLIINGLFVNAQIEGTVLKGVYNIPRKAFYRPGTLVIIDDENRLRFREVRVLRSNARNLIVAADSLEPGTRICLTALEQVIDGMQVEIAPGATVLPKLATEDPPLDETVGTRP
ncbi:MAG: efflux RND transporter periplasmic adaptor subunit, partial [Verrucomicrobiales bacterium]